jgi:leucyl-tRNA synthetase
LSLSRQLAFDEDKVLRLVSPYIAASMNLAGGAEVIAQEVARAKVSADEDGWKSASNIVESAEPGNPGIQFWTRH